MVFLSRNRDKLIVVEQETIKKYRTISKYFKGKGVWDNVKEMRMSDGYIFGKNLTPRELDNMSVYEEWVILILVLLSNHFIVDEEMVRTRPTGGYRKEYGT